MMRAPWSSISPCERVGKQEESAPHSLGVELRDELIPVGRGRMLAARELLSGKDP